MPQATPNEARCAMLQRVEAAYREWCLAAEALAAAEARLWEETLKDPQGEQLQALAAEVVRLREATRLASAAMLPLLQSLE